MTWQEVVIAAVTITVGATIVIVVLVQLDKIIRAITGNSQETRYRKLAENTVQHQEQLRAQLTDVQAKVDEIERRIREVD